MENVIQTRHFTGNFNAMLLKKKATPEEMYNANLAKKQLKAYLKGHATYTHGRDTIGYPMHYPTPQTWR